MAKKAAPTQYEPDADYEVTFVRPVARKHGLYSPLHRYTIKGRVLSTLPPEAIASAERVD